MAFASPSSLLIYQSFVGFPVQYVPQYAAVQPAAAQLAQWIIKGEKELNIFHKKSQLLNMKKSDNESKSQEKYMQQNVKQIKIKQNVSHIYSMIKSQNMFLLIDFKIEQNTFQLKDTQFISQFNKVVAQPVTVIQSVVQQVLQFVAPIQSVVQPVFHNLKFNMFLLSNQILCIHELIFFICSSIVLWSYIIITKKIMQIIFQLINLHQLNHKQHKRGSHKRKKYFSEHFQLIFKLYSKHIITNPQQINILVYIDIIINIYSLKELQYFSIYIYASFQSK